MIQEKIKSLVEKYREPILENGMYVITANVGFYGKIEIYKAERVDVATKLYYIEGDYDIVSIKGTYQAILWTDYQDTEPFNRMSNFYLGCSFSKLKLIKKGKDFREFTHKEVNINCGFSVWGFTFNNYWRTASFGMAVKSKNISTFITELKILLGK